MTYGLAFTTPTFAGVVTDRRLSGGRTTDDSDKCGLAVYRDGRVAYTLAGLAELGTFTTRTWLAEALCDAGSGGGGLDAALQEFASKATADVAALRVKHNADRKLTVAFAGYVQTPFGQTRAVLRLVSNFQTFAATELSEPWSQFKVSRLDDNVDGITVAWIGSATPTAASLRPMADLLAAGHVPPTEAIDAGVRIVREAARQEATKVGEAKATIGEWCSSVLISRAAGQHGVLFDYHPGKPRTVLRLPTFVYAKYDGAGAYICAETETEHAGDQQGTFLRVPRAKRHDPCPCGSKRPYKSCHGQGTKGDTNTTMRGGMNVMIKMLPIDESAQLVAFTDNGLILGPSDLGATALLSGKPQFAVVTPEGSSSPPVSGSKTGST